MVDVAQAQPRLNRFDRFAAVNMVALVALLIGVGWRQEPEFALYAAVYLVLFAGVWAAARRWDWPVWLIATAQIGVLAHFAGGLVHFGPDHLRLYAHEFGGVRYDKVVHLYNSAIIALGVRQVLRGAGVRLRAYEAPVAVLATLGIGACWEIVEYVAVSLLVNTGVGDYNNNMSDLVANLLGGTAAMAGVALAGRLGAEGPVLESAAGPNASGEGAVTVTEPYAPQPAAPPSPPAPPAGDGPPAGYAPPAAPASAPPKKKSGCWIAAGIGCLLVLVLVCGGCAAVYFGLASLGKPKDLGVTFTEADYWSAVEKSGVEFPPPPSGTEDFANTEVVYSGSKPIDARFTQSEVSALLSHSHSPGWPISDMQVRFTGGDGVELSGLVTYQGTAYPVYVDANASMSGRTLSGSINSARAMGIEVPAEYYPPGEQYGLGLINDRLARLEGLDIATAEVVDGQLHLAGSVPARAERVAAP